MIVGMKKSVLFGMAAAMVLAASCTPKVSGIRTETCQFSDEGAHARLSIKAELPVAETEGTAVMRQTLVDMMDRSLSHIGFGEDSRAFPRFDGDIDDTKALGAYYGANGFADMTAKVQADVDDRTADIRANEDLTEEEREHALAEIPGWEYDFNLEKVYETERIVVFNSVDYIYLGGATRNLDGSFPSGARIPLRVFNASGVQEVRWTARSLWTRRAGCASGTSSLRARPRRCRTCCGGAWKNISRKHRTGPNTIWTISSTWMGT